MKTTKWSRISLAAVALLLGASVVHAQGDLVGGSEGDRNEHLLVRNQAVQVGLEILTRHGIQVLVSNHEVVELETDENLLPDELRTSKAPG